MPQTGSVEPVEPGDAAWRTHPNGGGPAVPHRQRNVLCAGVWAPGVRAIGRLSHSFVLAVALGCVALLIWTTTASSNVRLMAKALIMDGSTLPVPSEGFMESAVKDFIVPTGPPNRSYSWQPQWTPERSFGISQSVADGTSALLAELQDEQGPVVVFGYSQSTMVEMRAKTALQQKKDAGEPVPDVTFVAIGVGNRANGGILTRLEGITILDLNADGAAPTDTDFQTIDIARQYDGLADFPQFPANPVALANAVLGVLFVHALYGEEVSLDPTSPKYVQGTTIEHPAGSDTTYYFIPTADLPLLDPLRLIGVPEQAIDVIEPFFKVLVEAGYDRSVSFGTPTPAQLIPVLDPVTFTIQLARAVVEGANNAADMLGVDLPGYDALQAQLGDAEAQSAATIGVPYRTVVRAINELVNPYQAFAAVEGPLARQFDAAMNRLGVYAALSRVVDPAVASVTTWAERNILFPQPDTPPSLVSSLAIPLLRRVAPHLGDVDGSDPSTASLSARALTAQRGAADSAEHGRTWTARHLLPGSESVVSEPNRFPEINRLPAIALRAGNTPALPAKVRKLPQGQSGRGSTSTAAPTSKPANASNGAARPARVTGRH